MRPLLGLASLATTGLLIGACSKSRPNKVEPSTVTEMVIVFEFESLNGTATLGLGQSTEIRSDDAASAPSVNIQAVEKVVDGWRYKVTWNLPGNLIVSKTRTIGDRVLEMQHGGCVVRFRPKISQGQPN